MPIPLIPLVMKVRGKELGFIDKPIKKKTKK